MCSKDFTANLESGFIESTPNEGKPEVLFFILLVMKVMVSRVVNGCFMEKFENDLGTKKILKVILSIWLIQQMLLA
jgi:hypothetical protein